MPYLPIGPAHAQGQNAAPVYLVTPAGKPLTIMEQPVKDTLGRSQTGFGLMITAPAENPLPVRIQNEHPMPIRIFARHPTAGDVALSTPLPVRESGR